MCGHAWVKFRVLYMEMFYTEHDFQVDLENLRVQLEIACRENTTLYTVCSQYCYYVSLYALILLY